MMTRNQYGKLHHMVFGKAAGRDACRKGWDRWQQVWKSGYAAIVIHPSDTPLPEPQEEARPFLHRRRHRRAALCRSRGREPNYPTAGAIGSTAPSI